MLSQHVRLHLFWHTLCILLIQIPWISDKSVTLFLGPHNQPRSPNGLACSPREIRPKVRHVSFVTLLQNDIPHMLELFLLFSVLHAIVANAI